MEKLLASALKGQRCAWPDQWIARENLELAGERIAYHGVAGLLAEQSGCLAGWPSEIIERIRKQAIAQAMWELSHRALLSKLLAALAQRGILVILLKGSALAYDLYPSPAARSRGDSDVLITAADLDQTRSSLRNLGYYFQPAVEGLSDDLSLQEVWSISAEGGTQHHIDLHWQLLNAPRLKDVLSFSECAAALISLPRLSPEARTMERVLTLIHTCVHRAMHFTAPYFVDGVTYFGGDRLIWVYDIDLLAGALSDAEWSRLCALSQRIGVSAVCLDGLMTAQRFLQTEFPDWVRKELSSASAETPAFKYLRHSHQLARAWQDLRSISGWRRKLAYLRARLLPSPAFIRAKYPNMEKMPLALLYARRVIDLLRARPRRSVG